MGESCIGDILGFEGVVTGRHIGGVVYGRHIGGVVFRRHSGGDVFRRHCELGESCMVDTVGM